MNITLGLKAANLIIASVMSAGVVGATAIAMIEETNNLTPNETLTQTIGEQNPINTKPEIKPDTEPSPALRADSEKSSSNIREPEQNQSMSSHISEQHTTSMSQTSETATRLKEYSQEDLIKLYNRTCPRDIPSEIYNQQQKVFWVQIAAGINPFASYGLYSNEDTILKITRSLFYRSVLGNDYNYSIMHTAWQLGIEFDSYATSYTMTYNQGTPYAQTRPFYNFGDTSALSADAGIEYKENMTTRTVSWYYADYRDGGRYPISADERERVEALANRISVGWQTLYDDYASRCGTSVR